MCESIIPVDNAFLMNIIANIINSIPIIISRVFLFIYSFINLPANIARDVNNKFTNEIIKMKINMLLIFDDKHIIAI
jgi:hypothetical protein